MNREAVEAVKTPAAVLVGVLIGAAFDDRFRRLLYLACEIALYHWAPLLSVVVLCVVSLVAVLFVSRVKAAEAEGRERARLYAEERERARAEGVEAAAIELEQAERTRERMDDQRKQLRRLAGSVLSMADEIQDNAADFARFVEAVGRVLGSKAKKWQAEFPESPAKVGRLLRTVNGITTELNEILGEVAFTDMPRLEPMEIPEPETSCGSKSYEQVYLKQKPGDYLGKTMKHKTKRRKRRA